MRAFEFLLLLAATVLQQCQGKTVSGSFLLESGGPYSGPEYEITKYSFAIGKGVVEGVFKFKDARTWRTSPALYMIRDENWQAYHKAQSCMDKVKFAHSSIPIGKVTQDHTGPLQGGLGKATSTALEETEDGMVQWKFKWEADHDVRTHGWFVIAADCALEQFNARGTTMYYELTLLNPGNTHLPADEYGLLKVYLFVFGGMLIYAAYCVKLFLDQYSKSRQVHLVIKLMSAAYIMQVLSVFFELLHVLQYKSNGYGIHVFDYLSEILEGLSQSTIAYVLICSASGWTLVESASMTTKSNNAVLLLSNPNRLFEGANLVIAAVFAFAIFSFVLQIWNKSFDDDFSKFHDYESIPGKILLGSRFTMGIVFIISLHVTIRHQANRGGDKLLVFLKRMMLLGGLWFLSFPSLVFFAELFPYYLRHKIVSTGVLTLQTTVLCILAYQFLSEESMYSKLSALSEYEVLPA